jgi:flavorubredoxin
MEKYRGWVAGESLPKAVIIYDTMWDSTHMIAKALGAGLTEGGVDVKLNRLGVSNNSDAMADILEAKAVLIGAPTINNSVFPTVASFLAYLKGLKPKLKIGAFFGSYGWGGGARKDVEAGLKAAGIELLEGELEFKFRPGAEELLKAREFGRTLAGKILSG